MSWLAAETEADFSFRRRYETLRSLLNRNGRALQLLADLEADLHYLPGHDPRIRQPLERLLEKTLLMAQELNLMGSERYVALYDVILELRRRLHDLWSDVPEQGEGELALRLDDPRSSDPKRVGGKTAGLALLRRTLGAQIPFGFTVTTQAYTRFLQHNQLVDRIRLLLRDLDVISDCQRF